MLDGISAKQKKVYDYYKLFIEKNGYSPTYQEASRVLGISPSVVYSHIFSLEKKGYLIRNSSGRVELTQNKGKVPVLGYIACGKPLEVIEDNQNYISVPENLLKKGTGIYSLIAKGDSMVEAGINDGDYLIIKQQNDVNEGEIGVVIIHEDFGENATLKRVCHKESSLILKPKNNDFESIVLKNGVEIRGKLIGVIKNYE